VIDFIGFSKPSTHSAAIYITNKSNPCLAGYMSRRFVEPTIIAATAKCSRTIYHERLI